MIRGLLIVVEEIGAVEKASRRASVCGGPRAHRFPAAPSVSCTLNEGFAAVGAAGPAVA
jgi:hypothetical protein